MICSWRDRCPHASVHIDEGACYNSDEKVNREFCNGECPDRVRCSRKAIERCLGNEENDLSKLVEVSS